MRNASGCSAVFSSPPPVIAVNQSNYQLPNQIEMKMQNENEKFDEHGEGGNSVYDAIVIKSSVLSTSSGIIIGKENYDNSTQLITSNVLRDLMAKNFGLYFSPQHCLPRLYSLTTSVINFQHQFIPQFPYAFHKSPHKLKHHHKNDKTSSSKNVAFFSSLFCKSEPVYEFWVDKFREELLLLQRLNSVGGIAPRFYGGWLVCEDGESAGGRGYQISERINGPSLDYLLRYQRFEYNGEILKCILAKVVEKIHRMNNVARVKHNDLHLKNILVDAVSGEPWIIDFGQATDMCLNDTRINSDLSDFIDELQEFVADNSIAATIKELSHPLK